MDFSITEDQRELLERLDQFCEENLSELEIAAWIERGGVPDSFMKAYYEEGFGKIGLPRKLGGLDSSNVTRALLLERLAYHAGATLPVQILMTDLYFVAKHANNDQIELLRRIIDETGQIPFSLAVSEPQTGSDLYDIATCAVEDGDEFIINGVKSFVNLGQHAPYIALIAQDASLDIRPVTGKIPYTLFLIPRTTPGIDMFTIHKVGQKLIPTADIVFKDARVSKDAVIGERGLGMSRLATTFEYGRTYMCATSIGMAQAALNQAVLYAKNRSSGGTSILAYQQIQAMVVDMQIKIDTMRALLYKTAVSLDNGENQRLDTALLKRYVPKTSMEVADSAMQIMGGIGYWASAKVARIWEECRGNRYILGSDELMTIIASKRITDRIAEEEISRPAWRF